MKLNYYISSLSNDREMHSVYSDGIIIGELFIETYDNYNILFNFEITESYRGIGLGDKFLKKFLNKTKKLTYLHVDEDNIAAIKLYEKNGFVFCHEKLKTKRYEPIKRKGIKLLSTN